MVSLSSSHSQHRLPLSVQHPHSFSLSLSPPIVHRLPISPTQPFLYISALLSALSGSPCLSPSSPRHHCSSLHGLIIQPPQPQICTLPVRSVLRPHGRIGVSEFSQKENGWRLYRYLRPLVADVAVVAKCHLSALYRHEKGKLFDQLVHLLQFYERFEINDYLAPSCSQTPVIYSERRVRRKSLSPGRMPRAIAEYVSCDLTSYHLMMFLLHRVALKLLMLH